MPYFYLTILTNNDILFKVGVRFSNKELFIIVINKLKQL